MLAIVVPYRDRKSHLAQFIPHMNKYLPEATIVVVEQADEKPFNRGRLLNIGFIHAPTHTAPPTFCFHDIDLLPEAVDYSEQKGVTQLAKSNIQKIDYLGGVTMFDYETFIKSGGYHNDYFHRAEDNCMMFNLKRLGIKVNERFGIFKELHHVRNSPEFIPELWQKAQLPRKHQDQLSICEYQIIENKHYTELNGEVCDFVKIKVSL